MPARLKAIVLFICRVGTSLSTLLTSVVLSRLLAQDDYGAYQQVLLVHGTLVSCLGLGLPASLNFLLPQVSKEAGKRVVLVASGVLLLVGCVVGASLATFSSSIALLPGMERCANLLKLSAWVIVLGLPALVTEPILFSSGRAAAAGLIGFLLSGVQLAFVVTAATTSGSTEAIMTGFSLASGLRFIVALGCIASKYRKTDSDNDWRVVGIQLRYAAPLAISTILATLNAGLDRFFVSSTLGASGYAIYANGALEFPLVPIMASSIAAVLTPHFVTLYKDGNFGRMVHLWSSSVRETALVVFPLTAFCFAYSADVIGLVYGGKYGVSAQVFQIYTWILIPRIAVFATLLHCAGRSGVILAVACSSFLINLAFNVVLVPHFGPVGAALSCVASAFANATILMVVTASVLHVGIAKLFPWGRLLIVAVSSAATVLVSRYLTTSIPLLGWRLFVGAIVCTVLSLCLIVALEGRERLKSLVQAIRKPFSAK